MMKTGRLSGDIAYRKSRGHFAVVNKSVQKKMKLGSQVERVIRNHGELNDKERVKCTWKLQEHKALKANNEVVEFSNVYLQ